MDFSVVIPSRNRPELLLQAIESVFFQHHDAVEIIVANDGSDGDHQDRYAAMATELAPRVRFIHLEHTQQGHGSSYAINMGAAVAKGRFLTFLDDDDFWTDPHHLSRTQALLSQDASDSIDVVYAEQRAVRSGQPVTEQLWLNGLLTELKNTGLENKGLKNKGLKNKGLENTALAPTGGSEDAVELSVDQLMTRPTFGHLNTTVIRRTLFEQIGGLDNNIRYENDRDFYLRSIDNARRIVFQPVSMAQHNVPDQTRQDNLSTVVNDLQKYLYQLQVYDKALLFGEHPEIRRCGREGKAYTLRRMAKLLAEQQQYAKAGCYARQALGTLFTFKWMAYSGWLSAKALLTPGPVSMRSKPAKRLGQPPSTEQGS